ncbi:nitroreductase family protein [Lacticaseibacillus jixiensis]|uniref:nitroreductase family protein n=1 Tax=Lacticaseibacillus jixiensis TaxID=3231926 RepID=UPI0036F1C2C2
MQPIALSHRSIRRFKNEPVPVATLEKVAQATSSSEFLQSFTMIQVKDLALREQIAAISGSGDFIKGPGALFIFVVDTHRDIQLTPKGADVANFSNWNAFLAGVFDATLAVQNTLLAAESQGLGGVILGSILNDPQQMIDLLHLPDHTFPLLGLAIGVPDQDPEAKPRLPKAAVFGVDGYPEAGGLQDYDTTLGAYYAHRSGNPRQETFTSLVVRHLTQDQHHRNEIGAILRRQGFILPQ